jgi:uncharacterized protein (TIGR03435 family)
MLRRSFVGLICVAAPIFAQTSTAPAMVFEVASIKSAGPLDPLKVAQGKLRIGLKVDGAICSIGSFSLKDLIRTAYEVKDYQITGPDWLNGVMSAERFNIEATMPEGATEKQVPQMLQALLADRFKLVIRREMKDQQAYAMVVGKGGVKMKPSEPDPVAPPADAAEPEAPKKGETVMGQGQSQVRMSGNIADSKGMTMKGPMGQMKMSMADGKMHMEAAKMTMTMLAEMATQFVGSPVVDKTELTGSYQAAIDLSMDDMKAVAMRMGAGGMGGGGGAPVGEATDPSGSSIFTSIQALGLKLEQRKLPMPQIVIEHVEKTPTEN